MNAALVGLTACLAVIGFACEPASATTLTTGSQVTPNTSAPLIAGGVTLGAVVNAPSSTGANAADPFGWDPWGATDTNSNWLSVGGCCGGTSSAIFNATAASNNFSLLWGSPNSDNTIKFYSGTNGSGSLIATVNFVDNIGFYVDGVLSGQFFGPNTTAPGYIESIVTSSLFQSAVLTNDTGGFEVANVFAGFTQITTQNETPLPGALWLFGSVLAGAAGFNKYRRKRNLAAG